MTSSNDFSKYYRTISNEELLNILKNPADYQPLAVEAAKKEFSDRQLSDKEIDEAKQILIDRQTQKEKQKEKVKSIEKRAKAAGNLLIETLNPIQSGIPSIEKTIRLITIIFGGMFIYQLIADFKTHLAFIKDIPKFPLESILYLLPLVTLPVAVITFWRKIRIGWFLLTIFVTFNVVVVLWSLIQSLLWKPSGNSIFDKIISPPPILAFFIQLAFLTGVLYLLCKQNMRNIYLINDNKMATTIGITVGLAFFFVYAYS